MISARRTPIKGLADDPVQQACSLGSPLQMGMRDITSSLERNRLLDSLTMQVLSRGMKGVKRLMGMVNY